MDNKTCTMCNNEKQINNFAKKFQKAQTVSVQGY